MNTEDPLKDRPIAVVGVSADQNKFGYKIFRDLLKTGLSVSGLNPSGRAILGQKMYKRLRDLVELPELVITVVRPEITEKIVDECYELGIKEIWMQPGSESVAAIEKAKKYGIATTHNACIMVQNAIWHK